MNESQDYARDDRMAHPLEPHAIMPSQFFTGRERQHAQNSERRLMLAILEDALNVYCNFTEPASSKGRRIFRESRRWIDSNDRTWLFSFLRICEALDLNPRYIRRGARMRRAGLEPSLAAVQAVQ